MSAAGRAWLQHRGHTLALAGLLLAGSLGAALADTFVQPHHFARLHDLAAYCAIGLGGAGLWLARDRWLRRPVVLGLLGLAVLGQLGAWVGAREVLTVGLFHGSLQPKLLVVLRSLADADRDGHSALVGGGDCDDFDPARKPAFLESVRQFWPQVDPDKLSPGYSGIRPKLTGPAEPDADFLIQGPQVHGLPGLVNLFGIESPGLTSSLAIAEEVVSACRQSG